MTPENRQTLATLGVVGSFAVVVGLLFLWAGTRTAGPEPTPGSSATRSPTAATTPGVVVATPPGYDLARAAEKQARKCRPGDVSTRFTAVTFNIHSGHGRRGASIARIGEQLRALHADIVLLQEVDRHRAKTGYADQPAALAQQLGMVYAFGTNVRQGSQEYGTAILSRFPIVSATNSALPNALGRQPRGLLHAVVDVDGLKLSVFNTHLDFHGGSLKGTQMVAAARMIAQDTLPRIVGGDLNSHPSSLAAAAARSVADDPFSTVGHGSSATSPETSPRSRIDYLLQRGPGLTALATVVPPVQLSDHRPVLADYQLTGTTTCT